METCLFLGLSDVVVQWTERAINTVRRDCLGIILQWKNYVKKIKMKYIGLRLKCLITKVFRLGRKSWRWSDRTWQVIMCKNMHLLSKLRSARHFRYDDYRQGNGGWHCTSRLLPQSTHIQYTHNCVFCIRNTIGTEGKGKGSLTLQCLFQSFEFHVPYTRSTETHREQ